MLTSLGQSLTEASQAAIVDYTMPAITATLSVVYLKVPLSRKIVAALILGMLGMEVLVLRDLAILIASPTGTIVMLLAAIYWSIGNIPLKAYEWRLKPTARVVCFFLLQRCWRGWWFG